MSRHIFPLALTAVLSTDLSSVMSEELAFPLGTCNNINLRIPGTSPVFSGETCHRLCDRLNMTEFPGTIPECTYDSNGDTSTHTCEDAKYISFMECQTWNPSSGPYERSQCFCGENVTMVCDSDYYKIQPDAGFVGRRPPLDCASENITDLESCIDVATDGGQDFYCNMSSTPCVLKYQKIGDYMMCTSKWRQGDPTVICGDACAFTEEAYNSKGTRASSFGGVGLAMSVAMSMTAILF